MKNIVLSIVILASLCAAGIGSTFADFSDIEISKDNTFASGSLDLVVSNYLGYEYPNDAPTFYMVTDAQPCCDKSVFLDLHNYGTGWQQTPEVYMHVKNLSCGWVMPKKPFAWLDENGDKVAAPDPLPGVGDKGTGYPRPVTEPEYVAEYGGIAGEDASGAAVTVEGMGEYGENCELSRHIGVIAIQVAGPYDHDTYPTSADVPIAAWRTIDLSAYDDDPEDGVVKLNELVCHQIDLGQLPCCKKLWVHIALHLQDYDEEAAYAVGDIEATYFAETSPWDHWCTNAYQADFTKFDMAFELFQNVLAP